MKSLFTFGFAFFILLVSFGQRPMNTDFITSKLDSIIYNSNNLYNYIVFTTESKKLLKNKYGVSENNHSTLTYVQDDTLKHIQKLQNDTIYEVLFIQNRHDSIKSFRKKRKLTFFEDSLIKQKINFLNSLELTLNTLPKGFYYEFVLLPLKSSFNFYAIPLTTIDSIMPLFQSYTLKSYQDKENFIVEKLDHKVNTVKINSKTEELFLVYPKSQPLISPIDICRFRLYACPDCLSKLSVFSTRNRRYFIYDRSDNKISLRP